MVFPRCGFKSYQTYRNETKAVGSCFESIRFEQCYFEHLIKANTSNEDAYNVTINFISNIVYNCDSVSYGAPTYEVGFFSSGEKENFGFNCQILC